MTEVPAEAELIALTGALLWAADHLEHWSAHMSTRDQRRAADWLVRQVRDEAVRVRDGLPDTPEGRSVASFQAASEAASSVTEEAAGCPSCKKKLLGIQGERIQAARREATAILKGERDD
jgi:hypothetical protein